jgi:quinol monooxygenase YgiN
MHLYFRPVLGMAIAAATFVMSAHAQSTAVYVVTYVDVMPNAVAVAAALLERYRDAGRKENGQLRFDELQEIGRPNRFVIVTVWSDNVAYDAHAKAASTAQFGEKLKAIENAPPDARVNHGLFVEMAKSKSRPGATYVVTHVDVVPPGTADCTAALKAMSTDTPKDPGNVSYEVLQQASRANHFTVVEAWANRKALDAHAMAAHTRAFREKLSPIAGALYDERYYKLVD